MKRKSIIPLLIGISLLTSCGNLTFPKKAGIRTNAKFKFTVAKLDLDLAEYLSPEKLLPDTGDGSLEIYDYNPPSNTEDIQQFMVRMPIQDIPLDFSDYLSSTDIGSSLSGMSFNKDISVPKADYSGSKTISSSDINDLINQCFVIECDEYGETIDVELEGGTKFSTVKYKSGSMNIATAFNMNGTVSLLDASNKVISSTTVSNAKTCSIPLAGKTITAGGKIKFDISGSPSGKIGATIAEGSQIEIITGLTLGEIPDDYKDLAKLPIDETIDTSSLASSIESLTFGANCKFDFGIKLPSGCSGFKIIPDIKFTGGIVKDFPSDTVYPTSLEDVDFNPSTNVNVIGGVGFAIKDATLTFDKDYEVYYGITLGTFKQVVVSAAGIDTNISVDQDLPAEAKSMLKSVTWEPGTGIKVTYKNTLPAGNDFTLNNVKSEFLGLASSSGNKIAGGTTTETVLSIVTSEASKTAIKDTTKIDFSAVLDLPGDIADKIALENITAGETYSIAINVEPVINWKEIEISNNLAAATSSATIDFNKHQIFAQIDSQLKTDLEHSLELNALPIYLYCEVPNIEAAFDNPKFNGTIKASVATKEGDTVKVKDDVPAVYLLGSSSGNEDMPFEKAPELVFDEKKTQIKEITGSTTADLKTLFNKTDSENDCINFEYSLSFATGKSSDTITIDKEKIKNAGATSINITAIVILPIDIQITKDQNVDVMEITGMKSGDPKWDLFQRTEAPSQTKIEKLLDVVEYAKVVFRPDSIPFTGSTTLKINIDMDGAGTVYNNNPFELAEGKCELKIDEPVKLLSIYPCQPSVDISLPKGRLAFRRVGKVESPIDIIVQTNGTSELFGGE